MTDKQFYDNQNKLVAQVRNTVKHYNIGVIEADTAMIQIMGAVSELDRRVEEIKGSVKG